MDAFELWTDNRGVQEGHTNAHIGRTCKLHLRSPGIIISSTRSVRQRTDSIDGTVSPPAYIKSTRRNTGEETLEKLFGINNI